VSIAAGDLLELHRALVACRSLSGEEAEIVELLCAWLTGRGARVERVGGSLLAWAGADARTAPLVVFDTHVDTVPPAPGWTVDPWAATRVEGPDGVRVVGLGANDAKAAVAAMVVALAGAAALDLPFALALALVRGEETRGEGSAEVVAELARRGLAPVVAVVGEPTGLDVAVAQKGLTVLELTARGEAAHAAHARALGAPNAIAALARDLVALAGVDLGPEDALLGRATLEPTMVSGGTARNVVPAEARAVLDLRTVPAEAPEALVGRLAEAVSGELRVVSDRFRPLATDPAAPLVAAALRARPAARLYGSATLSDLVFFRGLPAVKVGPGRSERSHRADEFVLETELAEGAAFYERLLLELAEAARAGRLVAPAVAVAR
jgi:acetylornithine deacetylase